jgi:epoxyqueuosine reductase
MVKDGVLRWAGERGFQVGWGSPEIVGEVRAGLLERCRNHELDPELVREELTSVSSWEMPDWAVSVIVVVTPSEAFRVGFDLGDRLLETILPPTYRRYRETIEDVRRDLQEHGLPGARVDHLHAPLKDVAARLGLVRYGRNNVTYAAGFGSYLQLCGYVTDAPLAEGSLSPRPPMLLPECDGCDACLLACPTGAIGRDRVLLHAERCLTFANERPGEWPEWVPGAAHHCLMGCLACQRSCPANPRLSVASSGVTFSFDETRVLLGGAVSPGASCNAAIHDKLVDLGQPSAEAVLGRNLRALMDRRRSTGAEPVAAAPRQARRVP